MSKAWGAAGRAGPGGGVPHEFGEYPVTSGEQGLSGGLQGTLASVLSGSEVPARPNRGMCITLLSGGHTEGPARGLPEESSRRCLQIQARGNLQTKAGAEESST